MQRPQVSILMYHALVEHHEPYMAPVHVEVARFAEQMAWLAASGHRVVPLAEVPLLLRQPRPAVPEARPAVALTFDDGYRSLFTQVQPILAQYGFAATLFLTTAAVGEPSYAGQPPAFAQSAPLGDPPLSWAELRQLQAAGWRIESHGCTHQPLAGLPPAQLANELAQSRAAIAQHLEHEPIFYAFPYGSYDRRTLRALAPAGYQAGFSVHTGPATPTSDLRRLPRIELTATTDLVTFQQQVATGYPSRAAQHRAQLRNWAYKAPVVRDWLQRLVPSAG
ncbi:polysaccharide deacetylase family protein [Hymenobacter sp. HMF4947]|uniref:Polysaccharide deacetylase family protein n=1 Tax=Hymenobacter ginkgonis TaxID=2682976 RepID=A0A7K1TBH2_9BACT|nr:polysaccharide deacetylase family protein [Hymenobacter ginkgonis]MVN75735.1 polysaccharide deacetylase family protein [Hymenobacter ginkgonis]